jgi:hypothetical protein
MHKGSTEAQQHQIQREFSTQKRSKLSIKSLEKDIFISEKQPEIPASNLGLPSHKQIKIFHIAEDCVARWKGTRKKATLWRNNGLFECVPTLHYIEGYIMRYAFNGCRRPTQTSQRRQAFPRLIHFSPGSVNTAGADEICQYVRCLVTELKELAERAGRNELAWSLDLAAVAAEIEIELLTT